MAHSNLIAAILLAAVLTIRLEAEAGPSWWNVGKNLEQEVNERLSSGNQVDAKKVDSLAKEVFGEKNAVANGNSMAALERIINHPDQCDESSLDYITKMGRCSIQTGESKATLYQLTTMYARKCITSDYIRNQIDSNRFEEVKMIDDQFIADYFSENPDDKKQMFIEALKATKAIAKAIIRDPKKDITDLKNRLQVHAYLVKMLYEPCSKYWEPMREVMGKTINLVYYFAGWEELISLFDKHTKNVYFRYILCKDISAPRYLDAISGKVVSQLEGLSAE